MPTRSPLPTRLRRVALSLAHSLVRSVTLCAPPPHGRGQGGDARLRCPAPSPLLCPPPGHWLQAPRGRGSDCTALSWADANREYHTINESLRSSSIQRRPTLLVIPTTDRRVAVLLAVSTAGWGQRRVPSPQVLRSSPARSLSEAVYCTSQFSMQSGHSEMPFDVHTSPFLLLAPGALIAKERDQL